MRFFSRIENYVIGSRVLRVGSEIIWGLKQDFEALYKTVTESEPKLVQKELSELLYSIHRDIAQKQNKTIAEAKQRR